MPPTSLSALLHGYFQSPPAMTGAASNAANGHTRRHNRRTPLDEAVAASYAPMNGSATVNDDDDSDSSIAKHKPQQFSSGALLVLSWLVALLLIAFFTMQYYLPLAAQCPGAYRPYNASPLGGPVALPDGSTAHGFAVVTDLDHDSKVADKKNTWQSFLRRGRLIVDAQRSTARVEWEQGSAALVSQISAGGRAMELSDLVVFDGHLLTVDDRTGIVYRVVDLNHTVPWVMLNDGPGNTTKGFKGEWMSVKGGQLYVGGLGKEWTTGAGAFENYNPMYVKVMSPSGEVEHVDWTENYKRLRRAVGIEWPGYMIHESGQWSDVHQKWFFLPRRASKDPYSETTDEHMGTNVLLIADAHFARPVEVKEIGARGDGSRGFSAFQFLPHSGDEIIVALKSQEKDGVAVGSYLTVFNVSTGRVLLAEQALPGAHKFEGLAFI